MTVNTWIESLAQPLNTIVEHNQEVKTACKHILPDSFFTAAATSKWLGRVDVATGLRHRAIRFANRFCLPKWHHNCCRHRSRPLTGDCCWVLAVDRKQCIVCRTACLQATADAPISAFPIRKVVSSFTLTTQHALVNSNFTVWYLLQFGGTETKRKCCVMPGKNPSASQF